jgi:amino acid transporter
MLMLFEQGYTRGRWDFIVALFAKAQVVCYNFIMKGLSIEQLPLN